MQQTLTANRLEWAVWVTRLVGLWVLLGAVLKLLWGTPSDLPQVLLDLPIERAVTYRVAIAAELCIALLALLRPRWTWLLVITLLLLFIAMLVSQVIQGETDCGCFGSRIRISPVVMLAIDGALLVLLLVARPWASVGSDATGGLIAILVVVGAAVLPWLADREAKGPGELSEGGLPAWVPLEVEAWPGKRLADTDLGSWIDVQDLPTGGLWVIYRETCPVCADLLTWLAQTEAGQRNVVLLRLPIEKASEAIEVHQKPLGPWVTERDLDERVTWAVTPPAVFLVDAGRVVWGAEIRDLEAFQRLDREGR